MTKYTLVLIMLMGLSAKSSAQASPESEYENSRSWELHRIISSDNYSEIGTGYVTATGSLRIHELAESSKGKLSLSLSRNLDLDHLAEECFETTGQLDSYRYRRMKTWLTLELPIFHALDSTKAFVQNPRGQSRPLPVIENSVSLEEVSPNFVFRDGNYTERNSISVNYMGEVIAGRLKSRSNEILTKSQTKIEISDYPTFICDLVSNKASMDLDMIYKREEAKNRTRKTLHAEEVKSLGLALPDQPLRRRLSDREALVVSGALMAEAMNSAWRKSVTRFGKKNFLKMHSQLFDSRGKRWNALSNADHRRISDLFFKVMPREQRNGVTTTTFRLSREVSND